MNARLQTLRLLSHDLRLATEGQLESAVEGASSVVAELRRRGLVRTQLRPVVLPELREPIVRWAPGRPAPDFEAVAWAAGKRLEVTAIGRQRVTWATRRARRLVGGVAFGLRSPLQVDHDLGVAAIYVALRRSRPSVGRRWIGEDVYRRLRRPGRGQKTPDGVIVDGDGRLELVLDYLTRYPPARLRSFHRYWSDRRVPYEWW